MYRRNMSGKFMRLSISKILFFFADPSREPQQHDVPCSQWSIQWNILQNYCLLSLASYNVSYWKGFLYHWTWVCCPSVQNTARKVRENRVLRLIFYYEKFGVVTRVTKKITLFYCRGCFIYRRLVIKYILRWRFH